MVNGFLTDLFQKWKNQGSNHEVTIVLFSRTFYQASSLDEFPKHMRECLQRDYKGRFYEDFYRVAVQNERYEDWSHVLNLLRKLFCNYKKSVLEYNNRPGVTIPKAVNSTAAQGNFLEVLNMSLNGPTGNLIQQHHYQANAPNVASGSGQSPQKGAKPSAQGVDWKSLTIPACLPITTDYFPDDVCLRTDYVFSDYNLLPDAVNADYARQRIIYRKPLQTLEVFQELISQRLAQVIVEFWGSICSFDIAGTSWSGTEPSTLQRRNSGETSDQWEQEAGAFILKSVKRVSIQTVLEDYRAFSRSSLKYWRFRIFVLPACPAPTRKILEGASQCDLYNGLTIDEQQSLVENFLKYIEAWINKIKRPQTQKKPR
ncbi:unnamed protein product, partial [Nesidiocoris tenuis]